jgi:hypothetical protein
MRLPFPLLHLFQFHSEPAPVQVRKRATDVPLAEMDDSVPTMNLWSGAMMVLALGFSRNRLSARQRAAGMAKRAIRRHDA